jgi:hypothetical protein
MHCTGPHDGFTRAAFPPIAKHNRSYKTWQTSLPTISILHITISKALFDPFFPSHFFHPMSPNLGSQSIGIWSATMSVMSGRSLHNGHAPVDVLHHGTPP